MIQKSNLSVSVRPIDPYFHIGESFIYVIFFDLLVLDSKCGQNGGHERLYLCVESCKTFCGSVKKQVVVNLKIIFSKSQEQTIQHLQFKFDPLPAESAAFCPFCQRYLGIFLDATRWLFKHIMWYSILEIIVFSILQWFLGRCFTKKPIS